MAMNASRIDRNENGSTRLQTSNRRGFLRVTGASLLAASAASVADAAHDDDKQDVTLPLGSTGLVFGQSLRTTLTNFGRRRISVRPTIMDADGEVVKQAREPLALEPGQMSTFEISRTEVGGRDRTTLIRTELAVRREDLRNLWIASEVVADDTGQTLFVIIQIIGVLIGT
jgi:hypothetical protein